MSTLSVPLNKNLEEIVNSFVKKRVRFQQSRSYAQGADFSRRRRSRSRCFEGGKRADIVWDLKELMKKSSFTFLIIMEGLFLSIADIYQKIKISRSGFARRNNGKNRIIQRREKSQTIESP